MAIIKVANNHNSVDDIGKLGILVNIAGGNVKLSLENDWAKPLVSATVLEALITITEKVETM